MKKIAILLLLISSAFTINAQTYSPRTNTPHITPKTATKSNGFDVRKLTFGGGLGVALGDYTSIQVSPKVGYNFTDNINAGLGFSYSYFKDDYSHIDRWEEKNHYFGFSTYLNYYPIKNIILKVEPEIMRMWSTLENKSSRVKDKEEKFIPAVVIGAGLRMGPIVGTINYDVVQDSNTPYGDSVFFNVSFLF